MQDMTMGPGYLMSAEELKTVNPHGCTGLYIAELTWVRKFYYYSFITYKRFPLTHYKPIS